MQKLLKDKLERDLGRPLSADRDGDAASKEAAGAGSEGNIVPPELDQVGRLRSKSLDFRTLFWVDYCWFVVVVVDSPVDSPAAASKETSSRRVGRLVVFGQRLLVFAVAVAVAVAVGIVVDR